jgi:SP family general alpha glucoside:H+ symporter-like MFS transporter
VVQFLTAYIFTLIPSHPTSSLLASNPFNMASAAGQRQSSDATAHNEKQLPIHAHSTIIAPNSEAQHAASDEKEMTLLQGLKLYPKAVGWSVVLSSALIMEGYDLALLGSLYGNEQFKRKYGVQNAETGKWAMQASWQSAL